MAGRKGFENLEPIFGEAEAEFDGELFSSGRRPFLFYVHALHDFSRLKIVASDFHSHTFAQTLTVHQLNDLVIFPFHPSLFSQLTANSVSITVGVSDLILGV